MLDRERALSALYAIDPGTNRATWLRIAIAAKAAGLTFEDFHEWSSHAPNYGSEKDCRAAWDGKQATGALTERSLFRMAHDSGWKDPGRRPLEQRPTHARVGRHLALVQRKQSALRPGTTAADLWERCAAASAANPYIVEKCGTPDGLWTVQEEITIAGQSVLGWLVVPVYSLDYKLRTLQFIPPPGQGKKLNLPGASFADGLFIVGDINTSQRAYIVEGIGQAWACNAATGHAAVVCFGAGRMATVAELLRLRFPLLSLVLVPDRGKESQATEIAKKYRAQWVALPIDKPENYDANDYAKEHATDALAGLLNAPQTPATRFRIVGADEVLKGAPLRWTVRGVIPAQGLACIYGASGSGKSFLALDLCAAVADGKQPWFGRRLERTPVVYAALEGEHGFRQRVNAWQLHHGRDVPTNLRFVLQPFDLRERQDLSDLADAATASGAGRGLLVIDTLNRATGGSDENSSKDMGDIIDAAKTLQSQLGGTVLLVHHTGKDQTKGLRGHSSLHAALDAAIEVLRNNERREWRIAKSKDDCDSAAHAFRLQIVEIGKDEYGEPVTSCAVVPDDSPVELRRAIPPKSGNQRVAWDVVGEICRKAGDMRPQDAPERLPYGNPAVQLETALEAVGARLVCELKRKRERAQQALTGLQARGLIEIDGGYLWVA